MKNYIIEKLQELKLKNWFFNRLLCEHEYKWVRNIYGDEINIRDGKRSVHICTKCGKLKYENFLKL